MTATQGPLLNRCLRLVSRFQKNPGLGFENLESTNEHGEAWKNCTGLSILPTQTGHKFSGEILQNLHIFALIDPPKMGNLMIPVFIYPKNQRLDHPFLRGE